MGLTYQINDYFCDKWLQNSEKGKFLVGSVDILQSNTNSDFQVNVLKEYFLKKWRLFLIWDLDTKDVLLLRQTTIWIK